MPSTESSSTPVLALQNSEDNRLKVVLPLESHKTQGHGHHHHLHRHNKHHHHHHPKKLKRKKFEDGQETDWWFASTAVPLLAATIGPMANVLSIGALVTFWRMDLRDADGNIVGDLEGTPFKDPRWCYWINVTSLIFGFVGNIFLLFNFTQRIRYIIALPMTIICWYIATGLLTGVLVAMEVHIPPIRPYQTYTQGFWYGVCASCSYMICSMLLMVNMLGHFLGHYPDTFTLSDHQRTLILQTMLFFVWLAGGGAMFSRIESAQGWGFVDGLYFCDVTILTIGFGDIVPSSDLGRGMVFPFSVGGIIMLGLVIASIHRFARELSEDKVVKHHFEKVRLRTWDRTVSSSAEIPRRNSANSDLLIHPDQRNNLNISNQHNELHRETSRGSAMMRTRSVMRTINPVSRKKRKPKLIILREEKDRFDTMRKIQHKTTTFKRWWALTMSVIAFSILWLVGAVVFWQTEKGPQHMTYFQALYLCYVSLLTIGYGDLAPKSNAGRCFFVVWSLIAVPTMTVLISDMGDTVISNFKKGFDRLADFTVLPEKGLWRRFLEKHPWLLMYVQSWVEESKRKRRMKEGLPVGPPDEDIEHSHPQTIEAIAAEAEQNEAEGRDLSEAELARRLAVAIRKAAYDMNSEHKVKYNYEEWVEFTRLIRFTTKAAEEVDEEEEDEGLVEWDWIGEDSPMMAQQSEPQFVLDRLCESLVRYVRRKEDPLSGRPGETTGHAGDEGIVEEDDP